MTKVAHRRGFTLVELLVVVLILAILTAIGVPLYLKSVETAQLRTCQANMQTIATTVTSEMAKDKFANPDSQYAGPPSTSVEHDLLTVPNCPLGGSYSVSFAVTHVPTVTCTIHGGYTMGTAPP